MDKPTRKMFNEVKRTANALRRVEKTYGRMGVLFALNEWFSNPHYPFNHFTQRRKR